MTKEKKQNENLNKIQSSEDLRPLREGPMKGGVGTPPTTPRPPSPGHQGVKKK